MREDNYSVIDELTNDIIVLDQVILSKPYILENAFSAYSKSLKYIKTKKSY